MQRQRAERIVAHHVATGRFASIGSRSISGNSNQSTSPVCNAAAAVAGSGCTIHSTRSKFTTLPPEKYSGFSCRGT